MVVHPQFDPVALHVGPLSIRWYGLMYLIGFVAVVLLGRYRIRRRPDAGWTPQSLDDMVFYGVLGVVIGGRLGYVLFYKFNEYLQDPLHIFYVWEGGMSFHGGLLGVIIALLIYARRTGRPWLAITDFIAPLTPIGLGAGRIGNFINAELWGRPTDVSWAMVFPNIDTEPRHPSQLYEACTEGLILFVILWVYSMKPRPRGAVSGLFLLCYGVMRFGVEYTREPDAFLGLLGGLSMGQWLCVPMALAGAALMIWSARAKPGPGASTPVPK